MVPATPQRQPPGGVRRSVSIGVNGGTSSRTSSRLDVKEIHSWLGPQKPVQLHNGALSRSTRKSVRQDAVLAASKATALESASAAALSEESTAAGTTEESSSSSSSGASGTKWQRRSDASVALQRSSSATAANHCLSPKDAKKWLWPQRRVTLHNPTASTALQPELLRNGASLDLGTLGSSTHAPGSDAEQWLWPDADSDSAISKRAAPRRRRTEGAVDASTTALVARRSLIRENTKILQRTQQDGEAAEQLPEIERLHHGARMHHDHSNLAHAAGAVTTGGNASATPDLSTASSVSSQAVPTAGQESVSVSVGHPAAPVPAAQQVVVGYKTVLVEVEIEVQRPAHVTPAHDELSQALHRLDVLRHQAQHLEEGGIQSSSAAPFRSSYSAARHNARSFGPRRFSFPRRFSGRGPRPPGLRSSGHRTPSLEHLMSRHAGMHNGALLDVAPAHTTTLHGYLMVRQPTITLQPVANPYVDSYHGNALPPPPTATGAEASPAPAVSAQTQDSSQQVQPSHADHSGIALAAPAFANFLEQGVVFGGVSALAMELTQFGLTVYEGKEALSMEKHGPQLGGAIARGASLGAAGASLAFIWGPVAPTVIMVGYGIGRECSDQVINWQSNKVTAGQAVAHATEVILGAGGGVSAAWGTAMLLSGLGGVTVAAAAGCCGLAGSITGRQLGKMLSEFFIKRKRPLSEVEKRLISAYVELGVKPDCSNKDLRKAFHKSARSLHPDKAGPGVPGSHERFIKLTAAMESICSHRGLDARGGSSASRRSSASNRSSLLPMLSLGA